MSAIDELSRQVLFLHSLSNAEKGTTVNVGVVRGGTRPNVVPAEALAEVDVRVPTESEGERILACIMGLRPHHSGADVCVEGGLTRPPWEITPPCMALYHRARLVGHQLDMDLGHQVSGGGSDGNFTAMMGIPTLDGLGPEGAGAHALDEHVFIPSLTRRAALLAGLLADLTTNGA